MNKNNNQNIMSNSALNTVNQKIMEKDDDNINYNYIQN